MFPHNKKVLLNSSKQGIHDILIKCTSGLTARHLQKFILLCSSFLLGRSGRVRYSLVVLLVAALLSEWEWVNTELFGSWLPELTSQRHSALISSDSEYFQICFSAVHYLKISEQRWFSSEQRWKRKFSELKIIAETALHSADFWIIENDKYWLIFTFFKIFRSTSISRHVILNFKSVYVKKWATNIYFSIFVHAKDITNTWIFRFTVTAQVTKQIWFNFSETFLCL